MRCQRKSGFQESRRERVAQINETVEVGLNLKNKILIKSISLILIQSFLFTGVIYPESINCRQYSNMSQK